MIRKIITIDQELCNGCAACVTACHENAIGMRDGKAVLLRDDYCDGLGNCLPACPANAISFEEREALPYDEEAVLAGIREKAAPADGPCPGLAVRGGNPTGCPGSASRALSAHFCPGSAPLSTGGGAGEASCLRQWPVQIKLVPVNAPYFAGADVLVAADCTAFAHGGFHRSFMEGKVTLIGCPKLDEGDYADKLTEIFASNNILSVTVARMSVPCCGGMERAVKTALDRSGKDILLSVITVTPEGNILG